MNDKMRERFEAAVEAMNLGYRRENMTRNRAGEYHKVTFQLMWLAWQAACEECARRCERSAPHRYKRGRDDRQSARAGQAIRDVAA